MSHPNINHSRRVIWDIKVLNCNTSLQHTVGVGLRDMCVAVCCSMLQRVAACCSVLQRVAVCCSVLQRVAVCFQGAQQAIEHSQILEHKHTPSHTDTLSQLT